MIDKNAIDPNALQYYRMLKEAGFSAYFVGGAVRDLLLGKHPKDFDIATNATPHQIKRIIPYGRIIGRRFRHVMLERDGGRYEIVTFRGPIVAREEMLDEPQEGTSEEAPQDAPETEVLDEGNRKNFPDLNQFGNAQQDAIRRDFTINALFYDPDADELVDYVEGKMDVDRKTIRTIGEAAVRMEEDPIRILRAMRHKTKLGLTYDPALEAAMKEKAPLLENTSKDRIREEFLKTCMDRSLGAFLLEARFLGIIPYVAPWLSSLTDEQWENISKLWGKFAETPPAEFLRPSPDMGLSFMMVPLIESLVLEPYKQTVQPGDRNYLPDMKYFLSCEPLRNFLLRNLRISRAQTDHIVRTLFYWSRMTGLWLENGPPRRVIGRLFQHPPALLAARMVRLQFMLDGKELPEWVTSLADYNPQARRGNRDREERGERGDRGDRNNDRNRNSRGRDRNADRGNASDEADEASMDAESSEENFEQREEASFDSRPQALPIPDEPMIWNGPLHSPVLRPTFAEEPVIRWARKNQTVRAFRPSGVPNQPTAYALLKSHLVGNYKPELATTRSDEEGGERRDGRRGGGRDQQRRGGRGGRDRNERGGRGGSRNNRGGRDRQNSREPYPAEDRPQLADQEQMQGGAPQFDEDSIGNILRPGEAQPFVAPGPMDIPVQDNYDDEDDNIGNRLDAPPTSGHVGVNGEGVLGNSRQSEGGHNRHRGGGRQGGGRNNRGRGGRRGGGGRQGGGGRGFPPRNNQNNPQ